MDIDLKFALHVAPLGGALGSAIERLISYGKIFIAGPRDLAIQLELLKGESLIFAIYLVAGAVVTTAAVTLFPISLTNRRQLIGTCILLGMLWPSVIDRLTKSIGPVLIGN